MGINLGNYSDKNIFGNCTGRNINGVGSLGIEQTTIRHHIISPHSDG
ncbi:MAG: hypothetical protein IPL53_06730 [Ignavibacteria bacterium]|nr:hypothetical protein [Ignavibacteria bacterium]